MGDPPTINVSKVLKCKIDHIFSPQKHDSPKRGEGGADLGKIPTFSRFFFFANVPYEGSIGFGFLIKKRHIAFMKILVDGLKEKRQN